MNLSTRITGVRYVLAVKGLGKSADFYTYKLGFKTVWEGEGWHFLRREKIYMNSLKSITSGTVLCKIF